MKARLAVICVMTALLVACGSQDAGSPADDRLDVVATTTQVGAVADAIGAEDIDLTVLLEPGVEAHDVELTPAQGAAIEQADVVLVSGAGLEGWLDDTLDSAGASGRVRDLSDGIELREAPEEHEGDEHEGEEHEHGPLDPHYWLSGLNAIRMVENARDALTQADPDGAPGYEERAAELIGRLEDVDAEVRDLIGQIPADARAIVTDHDALGYFIDEYGLEYVGSVFPSLDVASEPSAREIEELIAAIEANEVRAIFTESAVDTRLAAALASETDATLVEDPLYAESLGPAGSGAETLEGMLRHNARVIHDALAGD